MKLEIINLKDEDLINYLLHPNMPIEVKELICERINKLAENLINYSVSLKKGEKILIHKPTYIGFTMTLKNNGYDIIHSELVKDENGVARKTVLFRTITVEW